MIKRIRDKNLSLCGFVLSNPEEVYTSGGLLNKSMWLIFKAKMLICQSKDNLDVKFWSGNPGGGGYLVYKHIGRCWWKI